MNDLLKPAINAHGGRQHWEQERVQVGGESAVVISGGRLAGPAEPRAGRR